MDAILLLLECVGIFLVMGWVVGRRGEAGLLGWRGAPGRPMRDTDPATRRRRR